MLAKKGASICAFADSDDDKMSINDIIEDQINFIIINQMRKILLKKHRVL